MNISAFGLNSFSSSGGEQLLLCPFHEDRKPSAWWNPVRNVFYCAVCGMGLSAHQLAERLGIRIDDLEDDYDDEAIEDYDLTDITTVDYHSVEIDHLHPYYEQRHIEPETIRHYNVFIKPKPPEAVHMVVSNIKGQHTGYVQRFIEPNDGKRYKKSGQMQPLWPMHHLLALQPDDRIFIFEGPFSAMRWHSYGLQFGTDWFGFALMGAKANQEIADTVRDLNCVFLYDHDAAGINACHRMRQLLPNVPCYTLGVSVDDMNDKQIDNLVKKLMNKEGWSW